MVGLLGIGVEMGCLDRQPEMAFDAFSGCLWTLYHKARQVALRARQAWYAAQRMKWQPWRSAKTVFQAA
ncbi:hypothetical protein [Kingella oralis]|jgi:hypothetical protein|uniref:hypothetical protein n=1 Tax=Kingella oralis TaxID=505 RepID=UPI002D7F69C8|nr:hypothetical protein [Kingella oralis]